MLAVYIHACECSPPRLLSIDTHHLSNTTHPQDLYICAGFEFYAPSPEDKLNGILIMRNTEMFLLFSYFNGQN